MSKTINVASKSLFPLRLQEPMPEEFVEKPGLAPPLRTVTIDGHHHNGEAITRGIDAEVFDLWMKANEHHDINRNGLIRVVSDEEADKLENPQHVYGFEHGLKMAAENSENEKAAAKGSGDTEEDHDLPDMNATGSEPPGGTKDAAGDPGLAHANIANTDKAIAGAESTAGSDHAMSDAELEHATRPDPAK